MSISMGDNRSLKDDIRDYWSIRAETFDCSVGHEIFSEAEREAWLAVLRRHLGDGAGRRVLDLASGTGVISLLLARLGFSVTGLDFSDVMLGKARAKAGDNAAIRFHAGDAENTLEPSESFDAVATRHLVWTLPNPAAAFAEWHRVLKPGGRVAIIDVDAERLRPVVGRPLAALAKLAGPPRAGQPAELAAIHDDIVSRVHFSRGCRAEEVADMLRAAGFVDVAIDRSLWPVMHAQGRFLSLRARLERYSQDRYVIAATKPA